MNETEKHENRLMAGTFFFTIMICLMIHSCIAEGMDASWKRQIADHGCAEFYLDTNHARQWKWKQ